MSLPKNRRSRSARSASHAANGLTLTKALLVVFTAMIIAMVVSMVMGSIGWPFIAFFALGGIVATWFVSPSALFLLVASLPLFFGVFTPVTGWLVTKSSLPEGASSFSKTSLLTSAFPIVSLFPALIIVLLVCALLAVLRLWLGKTNAKNRDAKAQVARRTESEADRRNRSERLSVAELLARDKEEAEESQRRRTRARERDREIRRREQAEERQAEAAERIEKARSLRDEASRPAAERVKKARAERKAREAAAADASQYDDYDADVDFAPRRPDPMRRAGDSAGAASPSSARSFTDDHAEDFKAAAQEAIESAKKRAADKAAKKAEPSALDDNLYED